MRTLIISGTAKQVGYILKGVKYNRVNYRLTLFGQTEEHPLCVYITEIEITCNGYSEMIDACCKKYTNYFKTNDYNIVTMDHIIML